jgi:hypothetical protein
MGDPARHRRQPLAVGGPRGQPSWPPFPPAPRMARAPGPDSSAAPAARPPPGWILSHSPELSSSKAGSSTLASGTALALPCFPLTLQMCNAAVGSPYAARTPTTACSALPWRHRPRCAMTSLKAFCAVLCTGRALPPHSSLPSTASLGSPMAPACLPMAPPPARALEGTSSWSCPKALPSPTCPSSTPYRPPPPRQEQPDETTRSAPHMQEWSQVATPSPPFQWSRTDVSDNGR